MQVRLGLPQAAKSAVAAAPLAAAIEPMRAPDSFASIGVGGTPYPRNQPAILPDTGWR